MTEEDKKLIEEIVKVADRIFDPMLSKTELVRLVATQIIEWKNKKKEEDRIKEEEDHIETLIDSIS